MKTQAGAIFIVILTLIGTQRAPSQADQKNNHSSRWKRHLIGAKVFRDHGHSVEVGDLNGDGRPDALIAFGARHLPRPTDGVYWYEAPKDVRKGRWVRRRLTAPSLPIRWCMAVAASDMDNDGDIDVVALSFNQASVYLAINPLKQHGDINKPWRTVKILKSSRSGRDGERIDLVDIDGDGFRDVVFPRGAPAEVHVLFNPSGKLTDKWQDKIVGGHGGSDAHGILCADLDLDGDLDIVAASGDGSRSGKVYWLENPNINPRAGKWRRHQVSRSEMNYGALQIDDVDRDGRPDILVTEAHLTPGKMMWFKNPKPSHGDWKRFIIGTQTFPHEALSLDIDGDGKKEYWVGDASHSRSGQFGHRNGGIVYFRMTKDPTKPWTKIRVAAAPEVGRQCRAVDIDGDGDLDVVSTADHQSDTHTISIVWWENKTPQSKPRQQRPTSRRKPRLSPASNSSSTIIAPHVLKSTTVLVNTASVLSEKGMTVENGWYVHNGCMIWGYAQHNGWWRSGQRPNITRNAPSKIAPNRTEDLDKLTDAMLRFGYPGFEHNFGLWYDRRRDKHDLGKRTNDKVASPFLEQPWKRSGKGLAWDGLSKYDLTKYNDWYFQRLKKFADLSDKKGTILFHNCYMQHALLESNAHYVDFPWRAVNCLQPTGMPTHTPAANVFYDISHPLRRKLHRAYIRKCLDVLSKNSNVVFLCSEEYTGPLSFMRFWLDTIFEWEHETDRDVHVALGATKDVLDAVLADKKRASKISTIDLRYWWYKKNGKPFAPNGGKQVAGRYIGKVSQTSPEQFHRQIKEYRRKYPEKAIIHGIPGTRQHIWAALTAGSSMLIGQMPYPGLKDPPKYTSPQQCLAIQPTYDFIRKHLSESLVKTKPVNLVLDQPERNWCLSDGKRTVLVYALKGGRFRVNLKEFNGKFHTRWFNPRTGKLTNANKGTIRAGDTVTFQTPDSNDWALWLNRTNANSLHLNQN